MRMSPCCLTTAQKLQSIIDTTIVRTVECVIDESQTQEYVGIGVNTNMTVERTSMTVERTKIKVTLSGSVLYYFDVWIRYQEGKGSILGINFMVPAGIRLYLADGTFRLPEIVRFGSAGRRPPYRSNTSAINLNDQYICIPDGESFKVRMGINPSRSKRWVRRDAAWVPTVMAGTGQDHVLEAYKRRKVRYGAKLWCPVGLMYDREHDTLIFGICVC